MSQCEARFEHWGKLSYPVVWKCHLDVGHAGNHRDGDREWLQS